MSKHDAGAIVRQQAINWCPYISVVVDRINQACETMNPEYLTDIFFDAAELLGKTRRERTVDGMKHSLQISLRNYKKRVQRHIITLCANVAETPTP